MILYNKIICNSNIIKGVNCKAQATVSEAQCGDFLDL